jgi:hypothetical protein
MNKDEPLDRLLERTSRAHADVRSPGPCLDAETLAAFSEGALTADEQSAAEAHLADCSRCLAVVAAIVKTTPPPVAVTRPSWLSVRWIVPLATAAAAISAWILVQPPSTPPASAPEGALADAVQPREAPAQPQRDASAKSRIDALENKVESPPTQSRKEQDLARRNADRTPKPPAVSLDKIAQAERQALEAASSKPREARPASPPAAAAAPVSNAAPRAEATDERVQQKLSAVAQLPLTIVSPDPAVQWRIRGRSVERSADVGKTWHQQPTGTTVDLLAGAAPSANVCWIVGRSGVVLLTTDGSNWRRLDFPDPSIDLVSVSARDGLEATVTAANGRRYRTTDGGRTWTLQENPAAPF